MIFPAAFGFSCWVLLGNFSPVYAIVNGLWCIVFVEYWKRQEQELAIRWNVKNVSAIEDKRKEFVPEKSVTDPITGEKVAFFPRRNASKDSCFRFPWPFSALWHLVRSSARATALRYSSPRFTAALSNPSWSSSRPSSSRWRFLRSVTI